MQSFSVLVSAICGALLGVAAVFVLANAGYMPINDAQMRNYLLHRPEIVMEMTQALQDRQDAREAQAQADAIKKVGMETLFDPQIAFVDGPANATRTLVQFSDYNCPYCRASAPALVDYYGKHKGDTRFAFIEFPIKGDESVVAARASLAARAQGAEKYMAFHNALMRESEVVNEALIFANAQKVGLDVAKLRSDMARPEIGQAIDKSRALAKTLGIDGTPTFIINGVMRPGAVDQASLASLMEKKN